MQLVEIWNHPMCPVIFKPALNKVIETISELEEKLIETISELEEKPQPSKEVTTIADHAIPDESISRQRAVAAAKEPVNPMYTWAATSIKEIEAVSSLVKSITKQVQDAIAGRIEQLPPAQPEKRTEECTETHGVCLDTISRQAAINALWAERMKLSEEMERNLETCSFALRADNKARRNRVEEDIEIIKQLPPAQPETDILAWLLAYHTKSFELRGRYLPHEVIGWLIADFRKQYMSEGNENKEGPC